MKRAGLDQTSEPGEIGAEVRVLPYWDRGADFAFWRRQSASPSPDIQLGLERAWCLLLGAQIDQALAELEDVECQLDDLPPPLSTRYLAASHLLRSAALAFQNESLAVLAILIAEVFVEGGAGLGALATQTGRGSAQHLDSDVITPRERHVLSLISQGYSNKEVARRLKISPETVKSHVKRIFSKLSVSTRTEAVSRAVAAGLLAPDGLSVS